MHEISERPRLHYTNMCPDIFISGFIFQVRTDPIRGGPKIAGPKTKRVKSSVPSSGGPKLAAPKRLASPDNADVGPDEAVVLSYGGRLYLRFYDIVACAVPSAAHQHHQNQQQQHHKFSLSPAHGLCCSTVPSPWPPQRINICTL